MLSDLLNSERFVVTAEIAAPVAPDRAVIEAAALALAGSVDAVNVTDNHAATVKMSPLVCCAELLRHGVEPILQMTARDRNLMALQSDLIGAWAIGVRTVLALGGDPLKVGPYDGLATHVGDLDAAGLARLISAMNDGRLAANEPLEPATGFLIAAPLNPFWDTVERLQGKLAAGAGLFQSNIVYDVDRFAEWFTPLVDADAAGEAPVLIGIAPPRSTKMLRYMHERIPGVEVDERTFARMERLDGDRAEAEGIEIAVEIIERLRGVPGVRGVHIMAPGWETEAVPRIAQAAALEV